MRYRVTYQHNMTGSVQTYVSAHSFAIADDGVLLFYNERGQKISAYRKWFVVEENP